MSFNKITSAALVTSMLQRAKTMNASTLFESAISLTLCYFRERGLRILLTRDDLATSPENENTDVPPSWKDNVSEIAEYNGYKSVFYLKCKQQCFRIYFTEFDGFLVMKYEYLVIDNPIDQISNTVYQFVPIKNFTYLLQGNRSNECQCAQHFIFILNKTFSKSIEAALRNQRPAEEALPNEFKPYSSIVVT